MSGPSNTASEDVQPPVLKASGDWSVAVIGNPNTGKTTLFNALTGLQQHVGNYPGVTVERKSGTLRFADKTACELIDLPGTYSLAARSPDEMIAVDVLLCQQAGTRPVNAVLAVADASNPERNFYLISQLCELGLPVVIALNMCDVAEGKGIQIDAVKLSETLGVPVVPICANRGKGLPDLLAALRKVLDTQSKPAGALPSFSQPFLDEVASLTDELQSASGKVGRKINRLEAFRALIDQNGHAESRLAAVLGPEFKKSLDERRKRASKNPLAAEEVRVRYGWVKQIFAGALKRPAQPQPTRSDGIDRVVTHWFSGTLIFGLVMLVIFQSIFTWANPIMDLIRGLFKGLSGLAATIIPEGALRSLVCDGIIAGVGGVLSFLPQICILFFFIAILEDCGYMSRAAFLMDRLLSRVGLSGKSFIPMLSSFACAVPGIMATRTIENPRDRLCTILISPLMSCSARLPVYAIMIASFIPNTLYLWGWLSLQGLTLFALYLVGILVAIPVAWLLKKTLLKGETPPFLIELPSYKLPDWRTIMLRVYDRGKAFTVRAGTIILAVSIVVWALAYFPRPPESLAEDYAHRRETLVKSTEKLIADSSLVHHLPAISLYEVEHPNKSSVGLVLSQAARYDDEKAQALSNAEAESASEESKKKIEAQYEASLDKLKSGFPAYWPAVSEIRSLHHAYRERMDALTNEESGAGRRQSYFGKMGHAVEPVFKPLGWDWRISMAAIASFPAREVIVSTLGTIFNQGSDAEAESESLRGALRDSTRDDGSNKKLFNIPVALSIMVFFALCSQCAATLATIKRETNTWRWPLFSFTYMTVLAYIGAMLVYQSTMYLGWG